MYNISSNELILHKLDVLKLQEFDNYMSRHSFVRINFDLIELNQIYNLVIEGVLGRKAFLAEACRRFRRSKGVCLKREPYLISEIKSTCREDISILAE